MKIGEKIRRIRLLRGYKQENMAELLGMSNNGYGKIERNEASISVERLQQIAMTFEMDIKDILDFDENLNEHFSKNHIDHAHSNIDALSPIERKLYEETIATLKELLKMKDEMIEDFKRRSS